MTFQRHFCGNSAWPAIYESCVVWCVITKTLKWLSCLQASCANAHVTVTYRMGGISSLFSSSTSFCFRCCLGRWIWWMFALQLCFDDEKCHIPACWVQNNTWTWWLYFMKSEAPRGTLWRVNNAEILRISQFIISNLKENGTFLGV